MYEFKSRVRYSELDSKGRLSLPALLDYFQDSSTFHSEEVGMGVSYMGERGLAWVLAAWQIDVLRYPKLGEEIIIGTTPYEFKSFMGFRNFWMKTTTGELLAVANSIWTLLSLQTGKLITVDSSIASKYGTEEKLNMEYLDRKIRLEGEEYDGSKLKIMPHNLDTNQHVNNGQYIRIAIDDVPETFTIKRMRAEYKKQAVLGDTFYPRIYVADHKYGISLRDENNKVYANVEFIGGSEV